MVTHLQLLNKARRTKIFKTKTPHFDGCPFKFGTCIRVGVVKPKKPNSAQRKIAKVHLSNDRVLTAYIPGFGHNLQKNSEVMVRGGRVPDLPGCRYHVLRGKKDHSNAEDQLRAQRRSKFAVKRPYKRENLSLRASSKIKKRDKLKAGFTIAKDVLEDRINRLISF